MSRTRNRHDHPPADRLTGWHILICPQTGKRGFRSKKDAKTAMRRAHPNGAMNAYRCSACRLWHYGHLPASIIRGNATRSDFGGTA